MVLTDRVSRHYANVQRPPTNTLRRVNVTVSVAAIQPTVQYQTSPAGSSTVANLRLPNVDTGMTETHRTTSM